MGTWIRFVRFSFKLLTFAAFGRLDHDDGLRVGVQNTVQLRLLLLGLPLLEKALQLALLEDVKDCEENYTKGGHIV